MMKSMTGFGRAEAVRNGAKMTAEVKSLNHRFLEISLRLPGALSPYETEIRRKINERFTRGRIELTIRINNDEGDPAAGNRYQLNMPLVLNYHDLLTQLKDQLKLSDPITLEMLVGLRDVFMPVETEDTNEGLLDSVRDLIDEAISALMTMRTSEGESLQEDIMTRLGLIQQALAAIGGRAPQMVADYQRRLREKVMELAGGIDLDEGRLIQEVAIMADKCDVTEEIVRFQSHVEQFLGMVRGPEAVGRKLDFLIQEMGREINTIGSKCPDASIAQQVVDVKSELARLREQVQNIE